MAHMSHSAASPPPVVGIIMGSSSDWPTLQNAAQVLEEFGIPFEKKVVSAHRTPALLYEYATTAANRGLKIIIAGAGGAAHLPGCLLYTSPSPRDLSTSRMPSSA